MSRDANSRIGSGWSPGDPYSELRSLFVRGRRDSIFIISVIAAASVVWGLVLGTLFISRVVPLVAGWDVTAVAGASMGPRINTGDLIAYEQVDPALLDSGQIVVFENPAREGQPTVHRIVAVTDDGIITKGDANTNNDSTIIEPEAVLGVARMLSPFAGYPSLWITNRDLVPLSILLLTLFGITAASIPTKPRAPEFRPVSQTPKPALLRLVPSEGGRTFCEAVPHARAA